MLHKLRASTLVTLGKTGQLMATATTTTFDCLPDCFVKLKQAAMDYLPILKAVFELPHQTHSIYFSTPSKKNTCDLPTTRNIRPNCLRN
ncbi:uncharacterized protein DMAD_02130 [Drosophila madeirensis]|uniref:Uncharacterized protein n=1 Tax=Drosophila madeirensis TaxID=30013 RepID=A0AAU9G4K2_DROMD